MCIEGYVMLLLLFLFYLKIILWSFSLYFDRAARRVRQERGREKVEDMLKP